MNPEAEHRYMDKDGSTCILDQVHAENDLHSEKKGYQNGAPRYYCYKLYPFLEGHSFFLNLRTVS